jgi:hypothetical protein
VALCVDCEQRFLHYVLYIQAGIGAPANETAHHPRRALQKLGIAPVVAAEGSAQEFSELRIIAAAQSGFPLVRWIRGERYNESRDNRQRK